MTRSSLQGFKPVIFFTPEKLSSPPASSSVTDSPNSGSSFGHLSSFAPGLLSSALLGNSNSPSGGSHPPTPPRTPKSAGPEMTRFPMALKTQGSPVSGPQPGTPSSSASMAMPVVSTYSSQMPPLLSLAAINKSPNILANRLNNPGLPHGKKICSCVTL